MGKITLLLRGWLRQAEKNDKEHVSEANKRELEVREKERIIAEITSNNDNANQKYKKIKKRNQKTRMDKTPINLPILPPDDDVKTDHVHELFLYDIPRRWNEIQVQEMVNKISDKVYSISIKKQYKYQTVKG